jgi:hypothetical protein
MKLFDVTVTGDQRALFLEAQQGLKEAVSGKKAQFFDNIDIYLDRIPVDDRASMVERARRRILDYANEFNWHGNRNDLVAGLSDYYLSIFQTLEDYVHIGIDMETEGLPTALYTRNITAIKYLFDENMIEEGLEFGRVVNNLINTKTQKSLYDGNFVTLRLDIVGIQDGRPCFRPTTPRSNLDIGGGKRYFFIPVPFMHMFDTYMHHYFLDDPFKFEYTTDSGRIVSHIAGMSRHIMTGAYGLDKRYEVEAKSRRVNVGYDVIRQRYYSYDLESSLYSIGAATFRPELLDSIKKVSYDAIDKSRHNVDFTVLRAIFKTRINSAKLAQLDSLNYIDLTGYANMKDKASAIIETSEKETDKNLYFMMKAHPGVFGDIDDALQKRERTLPKFLKTMQAVGSLDTNESKRVGAINSLLRDGVVRITTMTNKGSLITVMGSNNAKVLERMLGKDYVRDYESIRTKLWHIKGLLESGEIKRRLQLEKIAVDYNILDYIDPKEYFSDDFDRGDVSSAVLAVKEGIERLKQKSENREPRPEQLLYRNIYATEPKDFFGTVNVNNIVSVEYSTQI